jgi:hypothetical protein
MDATYLLPESINLRFIDEENREISLNCDKVLYENQNNRCLVLECSQFEIIIKLIVISNPEGFYYENIIANDINLEFSIESLYKEYCLLKTYSYKKPEYFINVFNYIPLHMTSIYTKCFQESCCFILGYTMEKMYGDLKVLMKTKT